MKKIIYIVLLSVLPILTYAQIDVVAPSGNVGIGTTNPIGKLHIKGVGAINTDPLGLILEDAKLGIGVTTSIRPFHLRSNNAVIQIDRSTNSAGFIFTRYNSNYSAVLKSFGFFANATPDEIDEGYVAFTDFHTGVGGSSDRRFVIDNDGSMIVNGGGANQSSYMLHVYGNASKTDGLSEWTIPSDKRLKKNIKTYKEGLDLILKMQPISYEYNGEAGTKAGKKQIGVLAQELQKIAPSMVKKYTHIDSGDNGIEYVDGVPEGLKFNRTEEEYLSINTSSLKWIMVNAFKEQQEIIESQADEISTLKERLNKIETLLNNNTDVQTTTQTVELSMKGELAQNQPNPFNKLTTIKYTLPGGTQNAKMQIVDMNGRILKIVQLANNQDGQVIIKAGELDAGTYTYSLIIDGRILNTKKMVLTK